jgi:hypothetical protein
MIKVATPRVIPASENQAITEIKPSARRERTYRAANIRSTGEKNSRIFPITSQMPPVAAAG